MRIWMAGWTSSQVVCQLHEAEDLLCSSLVFALTQRLTKYFVVEARYLTLHSRLYEAVCLSCEVLHELQKRGSLNCM